MTPELHSAIYPRLLRDFEFKEHGEWLQQGRCPACGKKEMYARASTPWVVRCGRLNHCGHEDHVKDLYPDVFESWSDRHPKTPVNPNAAADAYLRDARGFDLAKLKGWYTQESYWDGKLEIGSATVRFPLSAGSYWDRLIDRPHRFGKKKAMFHGSYAGTAWHAPDMNPAKADELWIVEGIFDAIALWLRGIYAVSIMACNNYPALFLQGLAAQCGGEGRPELVWALDGDKAGRQYIKQWVTRARAEGWPCSAAVPPIRGRKKQDWNDLHQCDKLGPDHLAEYRHLGALLIAASAAERARLIFLAKSWHSFHVDFDNRLYWFSLDQKKFSEELEKLDKERPEWDETKRREEAVKAAGTVEEICDCLPTVLYYQANEATDDYWYYMRVDFPHDGPPIKNTFTSAQLTTPAEFKKRLFAVAPGALWTGKPGHLDRLLKHWTYNVKVVKTVDYIGYSKEHRAWIFNGIAIQNGQVYRINEEDYFELRNLSIKSLSRSVDLDLNTELKEFKTEWLQQLWTCFGPRGLMVLTFWFLSLFAEQIYERLKFFPFLELVGEPGSGKSTLIEFLWKLVGRMDWEGFDPTSSNTAAVARYFNQVSNLPVSLIEGDRTVDQATGRPHKSFEWDVLKKLYNRRGFKARGVKNQGNDTYDPPFRGTLVIIQNHPIQADKAVLERIIQVTFDKKKHSDTTRNAARKLETLKLEHLSGFLVKACLAEKEVLETLFDRLPIHEKSLSRESTITTHRIVMHHALLRAGLEALTKVLNIPEEWVSETHGEILDLAIARQRAISSDHPVLAAFWELFDDIEESAGYPVLNHSLNPDLIAINLTDYAEYIGKHGLQFQAPTISDLRRLFPATTTHKFIGNKPVDSAIRKRHNESSSPVHHKSETVRCWVFKR